MRFLLFLFVVFACREPRHIPAQWTKWYAEYRQWRGNRTQSQ